MFRNRRARWVVIGIVAFAAALLLAIGGNSLGRYSGLTVPRLDPAALSAKISPFYRVTKPDGAGPFPTALLFSGYVFSWGDVEEESRVIAALAGGLVFFWCTLIVGSIWWAFRHVIGKPRPFGRTAFNYGLVGAITLLGILGADEFLG